ncbi:MAG TPA: CHAT domain-containing protein [Thermoanaerobaculia bacterium]
MAYDDFIVNIFPGQSDDYHVLAESSGAEARGTFLVPAELVTSPWDSLIPAGRDLLPAHGTRPSSSIATREVGERLFQALFTDDVLRLFDQSMPNSSREPWRGLRLRLKIDRRLVLVFGLPWELLYLPSTRDFLGLSRRTPIARTLSVPRFVEPQLPATRLRILVIASRISCFSALDLEAERCQLEAIAGWRRNLDIVFLPIATREELSQSLCQARDQFDPFHVLHFMGHGSFLADAGEGVLLFEGEYNKPEEVTGQSLADEIKDFPSLRLVVLNACQTGRITDRSGLDPFAGVASALVLAGVPAVIAIRSRVSDQAAITLSKTLYRRLVKGDPVDVAMAECRRAIWRKEETKGEWGLPLLFLRGQIHPLFQVQPDPRLQAIARGLAGFALSVLIATVLLLGLRTQPHVNRVSPTAMSESLELNNAGVALLDQRKVPPATPS